MAGKEKQISSATTCYVRNGKRSSCTGRAFWTTGEKGSERKSRAQVGSGYLKSDLVSVSGVLVLGVLTLVYRIPELSEKRKRVNLGNSDAE